MLHDHTTLNTRVYDGNKGTGEKEKKNVACKERDNRHQAYFVIKDFSKDSVGATTRLHYTLGVIN